MIIVIWSFSLSFNSSNTSPYSILIAFFSSQLYCKYLTIQCQRSNGISFYFMNLLTYFILSSNFTANKLYLDKVLRISLIVYAYIHVAMQMLIMEYKRSFVVTGVQSPYPTVTIVVIEQQRVETYYYSVAKLLRSCLLIQVSQYKSS